MVLVRSVGSCKHATPHSTSPLWMTRHKLNIAVVLIAHSTRLALLTLTLFVARDSQSSMVYRISSALPTLGA